VRAGAKRRGEREARGPPPPPPPAAPRDSPRRPLFPVRRRAHCVSIPPTHLVPDALVAALHPFPPGGAAGSLDDQGGGACGGGGEGERGGRGGVRGSSADGWQGRGERRAGWEPPIPGSDRPRGKRAGLTRQWHARWACRSMPGVPGAPTRRPLPSNWLAPRSPQKKVGGSLSLQANKQTHPRARRPGRGRPAGRRPERHSCPAERPTWLRACVRGGKDGAAGGAPGEEETKQWGQAGSCTRPPALPTRPLFST
jgi:hypothetical protein